MAYQLSEPENMFNVINQIVREQGIDEDPFFHHKVEKFVGFYKSTKSRPIGETYAQLDYETLKPTYLYRYFTSVANACKMHWFHHYCLNERNENTINSLLRTKNINVCSIGGGPGTDLIGFYKFYRFLQEIYPDGKVNATILDQMNWNDEIGHVLNNFAPNLISPNNYMEYNVLDKLDPTSKIYKTLHNADVVSIVKFVSEFGSLRTRVTAKLVPVFNALKPGAMVFYLDNSGGDYTQTFDAAARAGGLENMSEKLFHHFSMEYPANFEPISNEYPTKNLKISSTLWQKPQVKESRTEESGLSIMEF